MRKKYYAVRKGHKTGIYEDWEECEAQTIGYSNSEYKSFKTYEEAEEYLNQPEVEDSEPHVKKRIYNDKKSYDEIGADETGKSFYGPMVTCAVYYDDEFNKDLFNDPEIKIEDSKKLSKSPKKFKKTVEKLIDPKNKLKFAIVEAIGDYSKPKLQNHVRYDYNKLEEKQNVIQAIMLNGSFRLLINEYGEPEFISYDRFTDYNTKKEDFDPDEEYEKLLKGAKSHMTDLIPGKKIIEGTKSINQADEIENSPSAAASIIAKYIRDEFFEFVDNKYPVTDKQGNPIPMPRGDDQEKNKEYGRLFIRKYKDIETFNKFTKNSRKPYKEIIASVLDEYVDKDDYKRNKEDLESAIKAGKNAIYEATTKEVKKALDDAKAAIDEIKTDAEIAAIELDEAAKEDGTIS